MRTCQCSGRAVRLRLARLDARSWNRIAGAISDRARQRSSARRPDFSPVIAGRAADRGVGEDPTSVRETATTGHFGPEKTHDPAEVCSVLVLWTGSPYPNREEEDSSRG